jgi:hypothetical protein
MTKPQQNTYPFYIPKPTQQLHQPMIQSVISDKDFTESVYPRPINNNLYTPNSSQLDAKPGGYSPSIGKYNNNLSFSNITNLRYKKN